MLDLRALAHRVVVPLLDLRGEAVDLAPTRARAAAGFGGFILFGGEREQVRALTAELRAAAPGPLWIASDLERGLGQQVTGGAHVPPLQALGAADSEALAERAGLVLGRAARGVGIDWVFGPVLDLAELPENPIVGTRSFGADPERVAALGAAYVRGLQAGGALACGKHFPGHGSTTGDSHAELPRVDHPRARLEAHELVPFRGAIAAGLGSVMTAHVAYPGLGAVDAPATLTPAVLRDLLRGELGFTGLVVTDALIMDGVLEAQDEGGAACAALAAGADAILYPKDPEAVAARLQAWAESDPAHAARLADAVARQDAARAGLANPAGAVDEGALALELARAALTRLSEPQERLRPGDEVAVLLLDDDDVPGFGHELLARLHEADVRTRVVSLGSAPTPAGLEAARALAEAPRRLVVVGCQVRAWKGRPGLAPALLAVLRAQEPSGLTVVGLCGPFPLAPATPAHAEVLLAYGDAPACQVAAAEVLLGGPAPGRLPAPWVTA